MEIESDLQADLSEANAHEHMAFLVEEVGERLAGTEQIAKAAAYIREELERCGLAARVDRFPIYHSYPGSAALRVTSPEERTIETLPSCHISSTLEEGIAGELVYVGAGGYEDVAQVNVRDKIVLADMTWAPPRPEKARIALEHGAKGLIILNWGTVDNPTIQRGAIKGVWGNPTPQSFKQIPRIPAINVTKAAGEYLKALCARERVEVWLRADATQEWVLANQPVGVLDAGTPSEDFVLVGSHLEGWGKTAICNSSGNALAMELARALSRHRGQLKRSVIFAFWDGHEIAEAAGSTYYVDTHWDELARHCVAYVNIDNPGMLGTSVPNATSAPEVKDFLLGVVREMWGNAGQWKTPYKGGDQSFFGVGVPYIDFTTGYTPEELERLNWASLSPWLHTEADTLDKVDRRLFEKHLRFYATLLARLCNLELIPYNLSEPVTCLGSQLATLKELSADIDGVDLSGLIERVERLQEAVRTLEAQKRALPASGPAWAELVRLLNQTAIKVSRELSFLWTEADRYGQDPYGYSLIGKPIPRLYTPLLHMKGQKAGEQDFHLWTTQFLRERNRVADALDNSLEALALAGQVFETRTTIPYRERTG